jgi:hypothetical protein
MLSNGSSDGVRRPELGSGGDARPVGAVANELFMGLLLWPQHMQHI